MNNGDEYQQSLKFWDSFFESDEGNAITEKFCDNKVYNDMVKKVINHQSVVLDFGCGSGFGLFEMYHTVHFFKGIGIDNSENAIKFANECVEKSELKDKLVFYTGNQTNLNMYRYFFDVAYCCNVLDVVPQNVCEDILKHLKQSLKSGGYLIVCLNHDFTPEEFTGKLHMNEIGPHLYAKDGILRAHSMSNDEWKKLFSLYFNVIEENNFVFVPEEKVYERRIFLLQNR